MATKSITDLQVAQAYAQWRLELESTPNQARDALTILQLITKEPPKVCYRAAERADKRGLIDYGTSLRTGWLTDKGNQLLHHVAQGESE